MLRNKEGAVHLPLSARPIDKNANIAGKKELSKMLLIARALKYCLSTSPHHPHLEAACRWHPPSPSGIVQEELDQRWRLGEQGRERRRIPAKIISI